MRIRETVEGTNLYVLKPEDESDILLLLYLLKEHYLSIRFVTEVDWQFKSVTSTYSKRLSRIKVRIILRPERFYLADEVDGIRITGIVEEASVESGVLGKRLGIDVKVDEYIGLELNKEALDVIWMAKPIEKLDFLAISVNTSFGVVALIGDKIRILEDAYFGGGKLYPGVIDKSALLINFIKNGIEEARERDLPCLIGIPGAVMSYIRKKLKLEHDATIIDVDSGGLEGLIQMLGRDEVKNRFKNNKIVRYRELLDMLHKGIYNERVVYGDEYIDNLINKISIIMMSTKYVINNIDRAVKLNYMAVQRGMSCAVVPLSNPLGFTLERYGGVIGLL